MNLKMVISILVFVGIMIFQYTLGQENEIPAPGRWSVEKAQAWYKSYPWLIGCNYIPATAINQIEMWQKDTFDPETIEKELVWAENLGFNMLRVYLHDLVWEQDHEGLYQCMDRFLNICQKHGMKVLFVFFDDCHRPDPQLGKQPLPVMAYHNSGWVKSPATELVIRYSEGTVTQEEQDRLRGYVQQTMRHFSEDPRILAWELYNEPGRSADDMSVKLLRDAWTWARMIGPYQPICSTAKGSKGRIFEEIALANSDVISFHCYNDDVLEKIIEEYQVTGRPLLCTEYLARPSSTFQKALPVLKNYNVAAVNWGFVSGKTGTVWPWSSRKGKDVYTLRKHPESTVQPGETFPEPEIWFHDIYRIDGTPYSPDEIDFIRKMTGINEI